LKLKIKKNLERLFLENYDLVKSISIQSIFNKLIDENVDAYDVTTGSMSKLYDEGDIELMKGVGKNRNLEKAYRAAVDKLLVTDRSIISSLKNDIIASLNFLKQKSSNDNKDFKIQIIFLEYDHEPHAYLCGFGVGDYPILEKPKYIDFNHQERLFDGSNKIDFSEFWKEKIKLEEFLDELDLIDFTWNSEIFDAFNNAQC